MNGIAFQKRSAKEMLLHQRANYGDQKQTITAENARNDLSV